MAMSAEVLAKINGAGRDLCPKIAFQATPACLERILGFRLRLVLFLPFGFWFADEVVFDYLIFVIRTNGGRGGTRTLTGFKPIRS